MKIPWDAYIWNHVRGSRKNLLFIFCKQSFFYYDVNMSDKTVFLFINNLHFVSNARIILFILPS